MHEPIQIQLPALTVSLIPVFDPAEAAARDQEAREMLEEMRKNGGFCLSPRQRRPLKPTHWQLSLEQAEEGEAKGAEGEAANEQGLATHEAPVMQPDDTWLAEREARGFEQSSLNGENAGADEHEPENAGDEAEVGEAQGPIRQPAAGFFSDEGCCQGDDSGREGGELVGEGREIFQPLKRGVFRPFQRLFQLCRIR